MLQSLKSLVVLLALTWPVLLLAKPICLRFMTAEDFARRRTVWWVLTVVCFLSPSFWGYVLVAIPVVYWAAKKDSTPLALFLMLYYVAPPQGIEIPIAGINRLFDLSNVRLMSLLILVPVAASRLREAPLRFSAMDALFLLYGTLQIALLVPYESPTNTMRRGFLFLIDEYVVFFVFSRAISSRRQLVDMMAALCLSAALFVPVAAFESFKGWLLYSDLSGRWGNANELAYLFRGDSLRAQASTGHSIALGYLLAMAIGVWTYLGSSILKRQVKLGVFFALALGLGLSYARGPWLGGAIALLLFVVLGSRDNATRSKSLFGIVAASALFAVTPWGMRVVDTLPFIGTQDQDSVEYRRQLAETSWQLVQQHPFFGNPFVLLDMESLRQGQGIIDVVNTYLQVALWYGLVGLALFGGIFLLALSRGGGRYLQARRVDDVDGRVLGASLLACMLASLVYMATAGACFQWVLAGFLVSYAALPAESAIGGTRRTSNESGLPSRQLYVST